MGNLAHIVVTTGTVKKWRAADPQWYYGAGYVDVTIKAFKCSNCGKYIGQYKLLYGNYCPNCGVKFEGAMYDEFKEKCDKLIVYLKKEKKKIDKKINGSNYKVLGEKIEDINYYFKHITNALKEWSNNKITSSYYECQEWYDGMLNGDLTF